MCFRYQKSASSRMSYALAVINGEQFQLFRSNQGSCIFRKANSKCYKVFSEKQFQNVTEYYQKSNFQMFWGIFRKAISKCFGVFSEKQFQNVLGYFLKSNFKMFWGIFRKAISKFFGVFSEKQFQNVLGYFCWNLSFHATLI